VKFDDDDINGYILLYANMKYKKYRHKMSDDGEDHDEEDEED